MYSLGLLAVVSFLVAFVMTPVVRQLALRFGLVDRPDGGRKAHAGLIPRVGGVAIALAYAGAFGALWVSGFSAGRFVWADLSLTWRLMPAAGLVLVVGLLDDLVGLRPWHKFTVQLAAAGLAYWAGVRIAALSGYDLTHWWWSLPATAFWLVFCTNAFNLIDGADGLATGVGIFATLTTVAAALMGNNVALAMATVPLAGALLGFLRYNFNPASIFLGDSGSYSVGFLLGCFGVLWSQKAATMLGLTAPLMALAVPLLDTLLAIVRRFLRGRPLFEGDARHVHHMLLRRGWTTRRAVLMLYAVSGLFALLSLVSSAGRNQFSGVVLVLFCVVAWVGIQSLGYVEIHMASRMLFRGSFRRTLNAELSLRSAQERLERARSVEEGWAALRETGREMGFCRVRMAVRGRSFEESMPTDGCSGCSAGECDKAWRVTVPLEGGGAGGVAALVPDQWDDVDGGPAGGPVAGAVLEGELGATGARGRRRVSAGRALEFQTGPPGLALLSG